MQRKGLKIGFPGMLITMMLINERPHLDKHYPIKHPLHSAMTLDVRETLHSLLTISALRAFLMAESANYHI